MDGGSLLAAFEITDVDVDIAMNCRPPVPIKDEVLPSYSIPVTKVVMKRPQNLRASLLRGDCSDPIPCAAKHLLVPGKKPTRVLLGSAPLGNILLNHFFTFEGTVCALKVGFHIVQRVSVLKVGTYWVSLILFATLFILLKSQEQVKGTILCAGRYRISNSYSARKSYQRASIVWISFILNAL